MYAPLNGTSAYDSGAFNALTDPAVVDQFDKQQRIYRLQGDNNVRFIGLGVGAFYILISLFDVIDILSAYKFLTYTTYVILFCMGALAICIESIALNRLNHVREWISKWAKFTTILLGRAFYYTTMGVLAFQVPGFKYTIGGFAALGLAVYCVKLHLDISKQHEVDGLKATLATMEIKYGTSDIAQLLQRDDARIEISAIITEIITVNPPASIPRTSYLPATTEENHALMHMV